MNILDVSITHWMHRYSIMIVVVLMLFTSLLPAQPARWQGQLSGWNFFDKDEFSQSTFGFRYLPSLFLGGTLNQRSQLDSEISLNFYGSGSYEMPDDAVRESNVKAYRLWLRFSGERFELRAGLQKINFGAAMILRPLMWFDRIDPRDPLAVTNGVYAVLGRYYFLNNANAWIWGLYGNDEVKGWEFIPSDPKQPEFGARLQLPLGPGEIAATFHHRRGNLRALTLPAMIIIRDPLVPENRFALDGKWDVEIGLWFETALLHQENSILPYPYRHFTTLGADYTFPLGNGLHLLGEHLRLSQSDTPFGREDVRHFSALLGDYSFGLLDRLQAIVYYDWDSEQFSRFASWSRSYDHWQFYLNLFWNPEQSSMALYPGGLAENIHRGTGAQVMVVLNH